jgi:predicted DNA-binding transcriptional regulator YafY
MRADRLLSILLLMQNHTRLTTRTLAARLEVSERTIHRDMEALGMAGIPIVAERGANGGWSLLEPYRTDLTGLNSAEIQSLVLSPPAPLLADLGLRRASDAALIKVLATLPSLHRRTAELARQRLHVDGAGWHEHTREREATPHLSALQEAVWQEQWVRLHYRRNDGTVVEREVGPLGLVAKGTVWYLMALVDGDYRTYRVSRVVEVETTGKRLERPADFDLAAQWQASKRNFVTELPRIPVTLRVSPSLFPRLTYTHRYTTLEHADPPDDDGWRCVILRFQHEQDALEVVLGFGPQVTILEPVKLREQVLELARATVARIEGEEKSE